MKHSPSDLSLPTKESFAFCAALALLVGFSTLVFTIASSADAFGQSASSCEAAHAQLTDAKTWVARYHPLASRGGVYRKAFEQAMVESTSAQANVHSACR